MLIGGFYSVDARLLVQETLAEAALQTAKEPETPKFHLALDSGGQYGRRVYTNNGRTATIWVLKQAKERLAGRKLLLPDYLCVSILTAVEAAGIQYDFYRVDRELRVDLEDLRQKAGSDVGMIYVIHYFGLPQPAYVSGAMAELAAERGLLVFEDVTQALFSRSEGRMGFGDFVAASTRKWFPMTDGGMAAAADHCRVELADIPLMDPYNEAAYKELLISVIRDYYDRHPEEPRLDYIRFEKAANASRYVDLEIRRMTEASRRIFFGSDKEDLISRRRENYARLFEGIKDCEGVSTRGCGSFSVFGASVLDCPDWVPFGLVLLARDRDQLYRYLVEHDVIPEIQWLLPIEQYQPGADALYLSEHNLMLQCDQRYTPEDMDRVAELLCAYQG